MPVSFRPRDAVITEYIHFQKEQARRLLVGHANPAEAYTLQGEPISSLFANKVHTKVVGITNAEDPFNAEVNSECDVEWNAQTQQMLKALQKAGVPYRTHGRGGCVHQTSFAAKRVRKWDKYTRFLVNDAVDLYRRPWWVERGLPKLLKIIELYGKRTLHNIEVATHDPELIIGDKPPMTGTGWNFPLDTRQTMAERFPAYAGSIALTVEQYNADILEAVGKWPEQGSEVYIGGMFRGITGGARSDCDVTDWIDQDTHSVLMHTSLTREVGNDPTSAFHNHKLNPMSWQREVWQSIVTRYHYLPQDPDGYIDAMTTPPMTVPVTNGKERRCLSVDYGATTDPAFIQGYKLVVPTEKIAFGADNISLSGIQLRTPVGKRIAMIKSGTPWTMMHYIAMIGEAVADVCDRHNLSSIRILQVGDDLHITGIYEELVIILQELGPWLRCKGMDSDASGFGNFILGHQFWWKDAQSLTAYVQPRDNKSVSSATRIKKLDAPSSPPREIHIGDEFDMVQDDEEVLENIVKYWQIYGNLVFFNGSLEQWREIVAAKYVPGRLAMAILGGVGEWALELFEEQDVEWREQQPVVQPEIEVSRSVDQESAPIQAVDPATVPTALALAQSSETQAATTPVVTQSLDAQATAEPVATDKKQEAEVTALANSTVGKGERLHGPHYHLPPDGKQVISLAASGRTPEQYEADKAASNPEFQKPGKDHADWPAGVPIPDLKIPASTEVLVELSNHAGLSPKDTDEEHHDKVQAFLRKP